VKNSLREKEKSMTFHDIPNQTVDCGYRQIKINWTEILIKDKCGTI
jgi:hypothetical protein